VPRARKYIAFDKTFIYGRVEELVGGERELSWLDRTDELCADIYPVLLTGGNACIFIKLIIQN